MEIDLRAAVDAFVRTHVVAAEVTLHQGGPEAAWTLRSVQKLARRERLWGLPLPRHLGGAGLDIAAYAPVAEAEGFSEYGPAALGSDLLLDVTMLDRHASPVVAETYLRPMVAGAVSPSFAMTEPGVAGSDPAGLTTRAVLDGDHWVVSGRKWFTSRATGAAFTTIVCRTEPDLADQDSLSLVIVPTTAPGYRVVRDLPLLGGGPDQYEIDLTEVRVPADHILGQRGHGLAIIRQRLALGRTLRCLRWLGQTGRAFDLMCRRMNDRRVRGGTLADRQLLHKFVFDSHADLVAARAATYAAVDALSTTDNSCVAVGTAKVITARAFGDVVDRAIQVYGAEGLTDDTPLAMLFRTARAARILDGPDELHITTVARRLLARYQGSDPTRPQWTERTAMAK